MGPKSAVQPWVLRLSCIIASVLLLLLSQIRHVDPATQFSCWRPPPSVLSPLIAEVVQYRCSSSFVFSYEKLFSSSTYTCRYVCAYTVYRKSRVLYCSDGRRDAHSLLPSFPSYAFLLMPEWEKSVQTRYSEGEVRIFLNHSVSEC